MKHTTLWLSARKKFRGGHNRPTFFKTIDYCFYCSFHCFFKNFRGQTPFRRTKVVLGEHPLAPPVAESQYLLYPEHLEVSSAGLMSHSNLPFLLLYTQIVLHVVCNFYCIGPSIWLEFFFWGLINVMMKWFIFWLVLRSSDLFLGHVEFEVVFFIFQLHLFIRNSVQFNALFPFNGWSSILTWGIDLKCSRQ